MDTATQPLQSSVVYLPSTARGLIGKYIRNSVFLVAGAIGASMLNSASQSQTAVPQPTRSEIIEKYDRGEISRNEYNQYMGGLQERNLDPDEREALSWLLWLGSIASAGVATANGFRLIDNRYRERWVNSVNTERGRITENRLWFPYGASTTDIQIDKITQVDAKQTSIDRMLGTGSVVVQGVVYTAAGFKDVKHNIPYIENPQAAKTQILERLLEKAGLELRLRDGERIPAVEKTA